MSAGGCSPRMAQRIVDLLMADSSIGTLAPPIPEKPKRDSGRPIKELTPDSLGVSPEEAGRYIELTKRIRAATKATYGSITKAEQALGLNYKALQGALRLERDRMRSQLRILRRVAKALGVEC